ncbi:hypothetical protein BDZ88DRAFT_414040 [Geranomyces variabilis]|nr:hypothetical protein BDZ88DRAFT_414040 [Geranomyces variabilis]KAJ3137877.1 hypothetical protein HDU90_001828 [Geranomyces variabilis]
MTTITTEPAHPRVLIIGAGIGGLALAQGLAKLNIPDYAVFDRDASYCARSQGYRLRIDARGSGALRRLLPAPTWELFKQAAAKTVLGFASVNPLTGEINVGGPRPPPPKGNENPDDVFTYDRTTLRGVLLTGLKEGAVQFNKEFVRYQELPTGRVQVDFADGTSGICDILVGADGVRSRVKQQRLPGDLYSRVDMGARCIYGKTPLTMEVVGALTPNATRCMAVFKDPRPVSLFLEPVRFPRDPHEVDARLKSQKDYIYWVLGGTVDNLGLQSDAADAAFSRLSGQEAKDFAVALVRDWHPSVRSLIELAPADQLAALGMTSSRPELAPWTSSRVVLIGDSIHAMTPTGGSGANTALNSAAELAEAIGKTGDLMENIRVFEEKMRADAHEAILGSLAGGAKIFSLKPMAECEVAKGGH